jgi:hypothetical protein
MAVRTPLTTTTSRVMGRHYFRELFRLQGELVKLQDWVVATATRW